jgi:hypothetical protein
MITLSAMFAPPTTDPRAADPSVHPGTGDVARAARVAEVEPTRGEWLLTCAHRTFLMRHRLTCVMHCPALQ